jgi:hypothetical protein
VKAQGFDQALEQRVLSLDVVVQRRPADTERLSEILQRRSGDAALGEQRGRLREDPRLHQGPMKPRLLRLISSPSV